ncbi:MAG: magnesium/cobalt transporter CorA [Syntrophobacterales bacterium]|nr:magnesium/cobalt transporter CorA [Syntrophobacterales bacterium]
MARFAKKVSRKTGLPPGTIIHIGEKKTEKVKLTLVIYDPEHYEEKELEGVEEAFLFDKGKAVSWLNVYGLHRTDIIEKIGGAAGLHPLVLEDVVTTGQHPKMEDFGDYIFITMKTLHYNDTTGKIEAEQVSLVMGQGYVITFQEGGYDAFMPVLERLRSGKGRLHTMGADYLTYALMDAVVDGYFSVLEKTGEKIEAIEDGLVAAPDRRELRQIQELKREMLFLRRSVWHLREVLSCLERGESSLIQEPTRIFFKDVYDHVIQVIDTIETYRDMLSGMLDIYLSSVSNRLNEVMKVLTIIATIFIPLTFVAGVYGMNFRYMPELNWKLGYPMALLIMALIAASMIVYFRRKKWF